MAKHVIKTDQPTTISIDDENSHWIVTKGATLSGNYGLDNYMIDDVDITVAGSISAGVIGIFGQGFNQSYGPNRFSIDVQKTGLVEGVTRAFSIVGNDTAIVNEGLIRGDQGAIEIHGDRFTLDNHGKIIGATTSALGIVGADFNVENHGVIKTGAPYAAATIIATGAGKFVNGADGSVIGGLELLSNTDGVTGVNAGRITASAADGIAVEFGNGDDTFTNKGRVEGTIDMGGGDDTINIARGKLTGATVAGGEGDDTFVLGKSHNYIAEYDQGGYDTVKTSRSYTVAYGDGNFIEKLVAVGKSNINLTGGLNIDATLIGNSGNNILTGGNGDDVLVGGKGADSLYGFSGEDNFSFFTGDGSDRVYWFKKGEDTIRLNLFDDIKDFDDLDGRISLSADQEDTIIDLGNGDRIRLVNFDDTLEAGNFKIIGEIVFP